MRRRPSWPTSTRPIPLKLKIGSVLTGAGRMEVRTAAATIGYLVGEGHAFPMAQRSCLLASLVIVAVSLLASPPSLAHQDGASQTGTIEESGYCSNPASDAAGAVWERTYDLSSMNILGVGLHLAWTDDEGTRSRLDSFTVSASDGAGASDADSGSGGSLSISLAQGSYNGTWTVRVECTEAGSTPVGPIGLISRADPGNSWDFTLTYTYTAKEPPSGGGPPPNIVALLRDPIFKLHVVLMVSSTALFLVTGLLAGTYLVTRARWADDPVRIKRVLASPRPFRSLAPHVWAMFFVAAVPIGMYVAGKAYGWQNSWTSFPVLWNPAFYDFTNSDHTAFVTLLLWALPLWLDRGDILTRNPHVRWWRWSARARRWAGAAPPPRLSTRELAIIYFLLGILVFMMFMVQPHGN